MPDFLTRLFLPAVFLVAADCTGNNGEQAPADPESPVSRISVTNSVLFVPVTIDSRTYRFLLDTGSSFTLVDNRIAAQITRLTPDDQIPGYFDRMFADGFHGVDGILARSDFKFWKPLPFRIGKHTVIGRDPWLGRDLTLFDQLLGHPVDGILGIEVFRQLNWVVDNLDNSLTVWQHPPATDTYQKCVPYSDRFGKSPALSLDYKDIQGTLYVDTGAGETLFNAGDFQSLREKGIAVSAESQGATLSANGITTSRTYLVDGLKFDDMPLGKIRVQENSNGVNNLGLNFLARFDRYLFIPAKMQFCYNATGFTRDEKPRLREIGLRFHEGKVQIYYSNPDVLSGVGLMNGDYLVSVNGVPCDPVHIDALRRQLAETASGELHLEIRREGRLLAVEI